MRRRRAGAALVLAALSATVVVGCGSGATDKPIPEHPSFQADVLPITQANCTRCHGGGGELNADAAAGTPPNGFFDRYDDPPDCVVVFEAGIAHACRGASCPAPDETTVFRCRGFGYYATPADSPVLLLYVPMAMPPPPAPRLADREVEILKRWTAMPLP